MGGGLFFFSHLPEVLKKSDCNKCVNNCFRVKVVDGNTWGLHQNWGLVWGFFFPFSSLFWGYLPDPVEELTVECQHPGVWDASGGFGGADGGLGAGEGFGGAGGGF